MNEQAIRFRLGIFVLAALLLLAVLATLFGGFPSYFKTTESYTLVFSNAQGISPGTPVRRSGVRIGEVRDVNLDNVTGKVQVGIRIDEGFFLRKGDKATLITGLIGGDSSIAFMPPEDGKQADPTRVPAGAVLPGYTQADAGALLQKTGDLVPNAKEVLEEIRKAFQRLDKAAPMMEETLKEFRDFAKATREIVPEVRKVGSDIHELVKDVRKNMPDLAKTNQEAQVALATWNRFGESANVLLKTNEDKITKTLDNLQDSLKQVNKLFSSENQKLITETLQNVQKGSSRLEILAKSTEELIKDGRDVMKDSRDTLKEGRGTIKQINETLKGADEVLASIGKATKPFGEQAPKILKNFEETSEKLNRAISDASELLRTVARGEGTVQKLLFDPSLYNNLNDTAAMATKVVPRLDRILRDMEIFADRIARHPESLGIGGVVRPSSGVLPFPR
jgi:phospholipid/cholesterol/gamma-HCH transport system substrate-binding protein